MKKLLRCPACSATRIAQATEVLDRADSGARKALAVTQPSVWSSKVAGELEAFACTSCGTSRIRQRYAT